MHYSKKYIHLLCAPFLLGSEIQADPITEQALLPEERPAELYGDMDGSFVQEIGGQIAIHPLFTPNFTQQLHYLIKRSYNITKREGRFDFYYPHEITHDRINRFTYRDNSTSTVHFLKPFPGTQGNDEMRGIIPFLLGLHNVECDYPGFVSLQYPSENKPPIIIVVFRGTQSERFQVMNGVLGPSWLTNLAAKKIEFPPCESSRSRNLYAHHLMFHQGYLEKYLSSRLQIFRDIDQLWNKIPEDKRPDTRFIITGHSQGAGIAIPAGLDITWELGGRYFGPSFDNVETPRFFIYALSGPDSVGDSATKDFIEQVVGRDNILRHSSVFDIVTYACPGEAFDNIFCKMLCSALFGVSTGYLPVGRLAFDDPQELWLKSYFLDGRTEQLQNLPGINQSLKNAYKHAAFRHANQNFLSRFRKIPEFYNVFKAVYQTGGFSSFVCLNHYGSISANTACTPNRGRRQISQDESIDVSFDPRLPDNHLGLCVWRGDCYNNFVENPNITDHPETILSEEPINPISLLTDSSRIVFYESDDEDEA